MPVSIQPDDVPTVLGMLKKTFQSNSRLEAANEAKRRADEAQAAAVRDFQMHRSAFGIFGFDPADQNMFVDLQAAVGTTLWNEAAAAAEEENRKTQEELKAWLEHWSPQSEKGPPPATQEGNSPQPPAMPEPASVREFVIGELIASGNRGTSAARLRRTYEKLFGRALHGKTIGMTLYRLSREAPPLARRDGRTWFYAEPKGGAKNPGAVTPGDDGVFG